MTIAIKESKHDERADEQWERIRKKKFNTYNDAPGKESQNSPKSEHVEMGRLPGAK